MKINETMKNKIFHEHKFKKFNTLKYKPKPTVKTKELHRRKQIN